MPDDIIASIRKELSRLVDEKTAGQYKHFFKEEVKFYGVKTGLVEKMAAVYFPQVKPLGKNEAFRLCEELLKSDYSEEAFIACNWAYRFHNEYTPEDFDTFQRWAENYINNWAKCDTLCNHTIGALVEQYPQFLADLKRWAKSGSRWMRRAAAVTLIIPAKHGKFLEDILEIADILLTDRDDLVQKGYGWMLKDAGIQHQEAIFDYVMKNKKVMPRTALRYAIERMPQDLKKQAMEKDG
jgi:3-methyladenine DNA glycosylase AlkD